VLKDATLFFSCSTPNLAIVIPAMDEIDRHFTTISRDSSFDLAIQDALVPAKATLNCYYSLTDSSEAYWIAMGKFGCIFSVHGYLLRHVNSSTSSSQVDVFQKPEMATQVD
jgi:hypothetical protein